MPDLEPRVFSLDHKHFNSVYLPLKKQMQTGMTFDQALAQEKNDIRFKFYADLLKAMADQVANSQTEFSNPTRIADVSRNMLINGVAFDPFIDPKKSIQQAFLENLAERLEIMDHNLITFAMNHCDQNHLFGAIALQVNLLNKSFFCSAEQQTETRNIYAESQSVIFEHEISYRRLFIDITDFINDMDVPPIAAKANCTFKLSHSTNNESTSITVEIVDCYLDIFSDYLIEHFHRTQLESDFGFIPSILTRIDNQQAVLPHESMSFNYCVKHFNQPSFRNFSVKNREIVQQHIRYNQKQVFPVMTALLQLYYDQTHPFSQQPPENVDKIIVALSNPDIRPGLSLEQLPSHTCFFGNNYYPDRHKDRKTSEGVYKLAVSYIEGGLEKILSHNVKLPWIEKIVHHAQQTSDYAKTYQAIKTHIAKCQQATPEEPKKKRNKWHWFKNDVSTLEKVFFDNISEDIYLEMAIDTYQKSLLGKAP